MQLLCFFALTFTLSWTLWMAASFVGTGADLGVAGSVVFLIGVFAPAIVALALTAKAEGGVGVEKLFMMIGRWQAPARWYVFALGYMAATRLTAAAIHRAVTGAWPAFGETPLFLIAGAILVSTWAQAGEEIGWRGYALPRMANHLGLGGAGIVLGVIWAVWHLPLFFLPASPDSGQSFPLYLLHVTALSVAMTWLFWKTGSSLLLTMLMHASVNNTAGIVPAAVPGAADPFTFTASLIGWLTVVISWALAAVFLYQMRAAKIIAQSFPAL